MMIEEHSFFRRTHMLRILGGILVIISCLGIGLEKSESLTRHREELEELQRIFTNIRTELEYMRTPIDELFYKLQKKFNGANQNWLIELSKSKSALGKNTFNDIWVSSIDTHFKESFLTKSELEELKHIGKHLSQPEAIRLYLIQLENSIQTTREEEKEKKKLYQSMGILVGIFLVLVLI